MRCPNVVSLSDHTVVHKIAICYLQMLHASLHGGGGGVCCRGGGSVRSGAGRARGLMGSPQPLLEVSTTWERVTHPKKSTHTCGGGVCGQPVWPGRLLLASLTEPPPSPKRSVYSLSYMFVFVHFSTNTPAPSGSYQRRFTRR